LIPSEEATETFEKEFQVLSRTSFSIFNFISNKPFTKCSNPKDPHRSRNVAPYADQRTSLPVPIQDVEEFSTFVVPTIPIYYWELSLLEYEARDNAAVAIGLLQKDFPKDKFPGWEVTK
jgi:hypothetical protein